MSRVFVYKEDWSGGLNTGRGGGAGLGSVHTRGDWSEDCYLGGVL